MLCSSCTGDEARPNLFSNRPYSCESDRFQTSLPACVSATRSPLSKKGVHACGIADRRGSRSADKIRALKPDLWIEPTWSRSHDRRSSQFWRRDRFPYWALRRSSRKRSRPTPRDSIVHVHPQANVAFQATLSGVQFSGKRAGSIWLSGTPVRNPLQTCLLSGMVCGKRSSAKESERPTARNATQLKTLARTSRQLIEICVLKMVVPRIRMTRNSSLPRREEHTRQELVPHRI